MNYQDERWSYNKSYICLDQRLCNPWIELFCRTRDVTIDIIHVPVVGVFRRVECDSWQ